MRKGNSQEEGWWEAGVTEQLLITDIFWKCHFKSHLLFLRIWSIALTVFYFVIKFMNSQNSYKICISLTHFSAPSLFTLTTHVKVWFALSYWACLEISNLLHMVKCLLKVTKNWLFFYCYFKYVLFYIKSSFCNLMKKYFHQGKNSVIVHDFVMSNILSDKTA